MGNIFGYMRISTNRQTFARQEKALRDFASQNDFEYILQFRDDTSGKDFSRPEWQKLERLIQKGDTIVFTEISRFTRQTEEGYKKYMELMNKGVDLIFLDNPTVSTYYIKQLINIANKSDTVVRVALESTIKLLIMTELDRVEKERELFIQRVKEGIQASQKTQGREVGHLDKMTENLREDIKLFLDDKNVKQVDLMRKYNISRNTLKKYIGIVKKNFNT